ncbi:FAD-dependent oxidoreductase [Olivibacter sitiensis]|uniref:FAD-dependent oxidoreductase n=1 Tax=Olivibacter sitiensis TaxID=376470 RepID=UPI0004278103|nr:FAD-dependent oxidoreductase [Olivibacter sitiensis]
MDRRNFLSSVGLAGLAASLGAAGCSTQKSTGVSPTGQSIGQRRLPVAKLSTDRIVKETVGLRPYRLSGPRIALEQLGSKHVVHNYGHGGSGFSLSWGSANLATRLVGNVCHIGEEVAVIGCGIMGLTSARMLQEKGYRVKIYAKDMFPNHTSSKATGTWSPSHLVCENDRITVDFKKLWEDACLFSFRSYQNLLGLGDLVQWIDHYSVGGRVHHEDPILHIKGLVPEQVILKPNQHPFRERNVTIQPTMVFNIPSYLQKLLDDVMLFGGKIEIKEFKNRDELEQLPYKCLVNCTSLGSKLLFDDDELVPISGQLAFFIPQPEITYRLSTPEGYIIPRKDGLVMGGTAKKGSWDTIPIREDSLKMASAVNEVVWNMKV